MDEESGRRVGYIERWRRPTLSELLVAIAALATSAVLVAEILSKGGRNPGLASGAVVAANAFFCLLFGRLLRFRLLALGATFTMAALTEVVLLRSTTTGRGTGWIGAGAIVGILFLAGTIYALRRPRAR